VFWHAIQQVSYSYSRFTTFSPSGTPCGDNTYSEGTLSGVSASLEESEVYTAVHAWLFDEFTATQIEVPSSLKAVLELWWPVVKPTYTSEQIGIETDIGYPPPMDEGTGTATWSLEEPPGGGTPVCVQNLFNSFVPATRTRYIATGEDPDPDYRNILTSWNLRTQYGIGRLATFSHTSPLVFSPAIYTMIANPTGDPTLTNIENTYADVRLSFLGEDATESLPVDFIDAMPGTPVIDLGPSITMEAFGFRSTQIEPISIGEPVAEATLTEFSRQPSLEGPIANEDISLDGLRIAYDWGNPSYCRAQALALGFVF
jgi:hypothetical protein